MKIEQFTITPIYDEKSITGFEISVNNHKIENADYYIKDGILTVNKIKLS